MSKYSKYFIISHTFLFYFPQTKWYKSGLQLWHLMPGQNKKKSVFRVTGLKFSGSKTHIFFLIIFLLEKV